MSLDDAKDGDGDGARLLLDRQAALDCYELPKPGKLGIRTHIVTPSVTARWLLNIAALAATPASSYG